MDDSYVIKVESVTKKFDNVVALNNVTFSVKKNHIFGYLGPNGAGKTTTIRILAGLLEPDSGNVEILSHNLKELEALKPLISLMSAERTYLAPHLSIERNMFLFGQLYGIEAQELKRSIKELLEFFGLEEHKDKRVYELSRGLKVRASLCKALINSPQLLFLDEPTSGVDVIYAIEIRQLIKEICKQGCTVFLTTHNMYEAQQLAEVVIFLNDGEIIACGDARELLDNLRFSNTREIKIKCDKPKELESVLANHGYKAAIVENEIRVMIAYTDSLNELLSKVTETVNVQSISESEPSLEDLFKELYRKTGDKK